MAKPRPKPIRLTQQRALALVAAADRGLDMIREEIHDALESTDLEVQRGAQHLDEQAVLAEDAIAVIRTRYLPPDPATETLF